MEALGRLPHIMGQRIFMFMGANIGNFIPTDAAKFLSHIREHMTPEDKMLIGFDLKKDPRIILAAYNDAAGHTRAFNLNLLERINRELGGDFDLEQFEHSPRYDPRTGACKSYLVSRIDQSVSLRHTEQRYEFSAGERIFMEISQKYSPSDLENLAAAAGFAVQASFTDARSFFVDQVWYPLN